MTLIRPVPGGATPPGWEEVVAARHREREQTIRTWSLHTLGQAVPKTPEPNVTNVVEWPLKSGQLTAQQIEITNSTPRQLLQKLATGVWSATDVLLAFIARTILAHHLTNPLTDPMFEQALAQARRLDAHLEATGEPVGPLHGLPISLKDVMNIDGMATTIGYVARADTKPPHTDELILRLRSAGAVFHCKTNVPQSLMSGECNNFLFGRISTPHNTRLSAGGSSGGEDSLIALGGSPLGGSPLGIGTDIAGSIRTPANFNGIYGLCPTFGRLPYHDAEQSSASYLIRGVAGPLSRSIDGLEVNTAPRPRRRSSFGMVANDGVATPHPPIQRGMSEVAAALERMGIEVVDVPLFDGTEGMWDMMMKVFNSTGGQEVRDLVAQSGEPLIKEISLGGPEDVMTAAQLMRHGRHILKLRERVLERWQATRSLTHTGRPVDLFLLPSGCQVAPPHGTMSYWLYEAISNLLDWPCATIPVGKVTPEKDPKPAIDGSFESLSDFDRHNWSLYSPEKYADAPICLQILGPRFSEERVLAGLRVVKTALEASD